MGRPLSEDGMNLLKPEPVILSKQQRYEKYRKRMGRAYISWLLIGLLGLHRFYADWSWSGLTMLLLFMVGMLLYSTLLGKVLLLMLVVWWLIDAVRLPGILRIENEKLRKSL